MPLVPAGVGLAAGDAAGEGDIAGLGLAAGLFGPGSVQAAPSAAAVERTAVNRILVFIGLLLLRLVRGLGPSAGRHHTQPDDAFTVFPQTIRDRFAGIRINTARERTRSDRILAKKIRTPENPLTAKNSRRNHAGSGGRG